MSAIVNLITAPLRVLAVWLEGLVSLVRLIGLAVGVLRGKGGTFKTRLVAKLTAAPGQRLVFSVLRAFAPNLALSKVLIKAYENKGTAVVTRREDVLDVLNRDAEFEVVYGPRMRKITDGENFFLGMQPGWAYERDTSAMRLTARRSDVAEIVLPRASELAASLVAESKGKIDVPQDLSLRVPADMVATYFGTPGPSEAEMIDWTTVLFWYLFINLGAEAEVDERALAAAAAARSYLDEAIAQRKANPSEADDVLNRCLALQSSGTPGMDDLGIRNNLVGLLIGAIPTISKASCLALDELLRRPNELAGAQAAARAGDDDLMAQYVWEALRFNPHNPVIYRRATRDAVVARSTLRAKTIPQGALVFAANFSAMFDSLDIPSPGSFRVDRPWETYIIWGYGLHTCFGAAINRAVIPAVLKPLLAQRNLRRAADGALDTGGTPFPQHLRLEFDPT